MKQYLLSIYQPDGPTPSRERLERIAGELGAIREELHAQGAWVFGDGLHAASAATVLRPQGGEVLTIDGPFTEGKEHVGGLVIVRAADLDAVLELGRRYASITGLPIEVRPFQSEPED